VAQPPFKLITHRSGPLLPFIDGGLTSPSNRKEPAQRRPRWGLSLTRMSAAPHQRRPRLDPMPQRDLGPGPPTRSGFTPPYEISYRGVKLSRVFAARRAIYLRRGVDLEKLLQLAALRNGGFGER
jgi:hypothetical protein